MFRSVLLICAVLLMAGIAKAQSQGSVEGTIYNRQGEPLVQAHIHINPLEKYTVSDVNGRFEFNGIPAGTYTLKITHVGYEESLRKIRISEKEEAFVQIILKEKRYNAPTYVVTATRSRRDIEDVPEPVTVISGEEIKTSGSTRLSEVLAEQTGLLLTADHGTGIQVQGFDAEYTKIMIDGQPLIGRTAGTLDLDRISVGNVQQVEMIKGPSSALWGSDALAGVINIITDRGSRPFELGVNARYASHHTSDVGINTSFRTDSWENSLFFNRNGSSGYKLNPESISQTVPEYHNYTGSYQTEWDISEAITFDFKGRYYREEQQSSDYLGSRDNPTLLDGQAMQEDYSLTPSFRVDFGNGIQAEISNLYTRFNTDTRFDYQAGDSVYEHTKFDQRLNKLHAQVNAVWNERNITTWGGGYQFEDLKGERYANTPVFNSYFGFLQHEWMPLEKWDLIAGLRFDTHSEYRSQFSPKLSARYKARDWVHFRASVGSGFKAPDFRQLYLDFTNPTVGYAVYGANTVKEGLQELQQNGQIRSILIPVSELNEIIAEQSWAFNAGIEFFLENELDIRINAFRNNVNDLIETAAVATRNNGQSVFSYFNLEKVYTQGVETQVRWQPLEIFRLSGGYQLLDARRQFTETRNVVNAEGRVVEKKFSSYEPMFNRSMHTANLKAWYHWETPDLAINIRGNWYGRYGHRQLDSNGNAYVDEGEYRDGYMIWDAAIAKTFRESYELRVGADNLFDFTRATDFPHYSGRIFYAQLSLQFY